MLRKVVSGGQTGVDRAALDAAMESRIPCGGFAPKGRLAEDGRIPERYPLAECPGADYSERTKRNVLHSDATLILYEGELDGGTLFTRDFCRRMGKPFAAVRLEGRIPEECAPPCLEFLRRTRPDVLNVAGPRESGRPGIYGRALAVMRAVFSALR